MNVTNKHMFTTSGEKALLAYKGTSFTITRLEASRNKYGPCWLVHALFEKALVEKVISLPATAARDSAMREVAEKLHTYGSLTNMTLCYRWRAYHLVPRERWWKPPSLNTVLFLR